jgi:O-antigen/teichoic acid export membrane protein
MSILKKLAGETAIYGLSSIVGRFLNYLLVPLYTGIFSPSEYGVSTLFYSYASFLGIIFTYGMETTFFRYAQKEDSKEQVFSTALYSIIGSSVIFCLLMTLFAKPLAAWQHNEKYSVLFIYLGLILAADAITALPFAWLRQEGKAKKFASLRIFNIATNIGLNILFYMILDYKSISYMFIANMVASLIVVPFFLQEYKLLRCGFNFSLWKDMMRYAYPLIFIGLGGMVNETIDRVLLKTLIVNKSVAEHQIGVYGANYKLAILITLFIQAFRFAAEPFFFARMKDENSRIINAKVMNYFVIVCCIIFLFVLLYLDLLKYFIRTPQYWEGLKVVPILLMANIFLGIYYNLSIWYKLSNKTQMGAFVSLIGAAITLILNYLWIPKYGYMGAAWATLCCYISMVAMSYIQGKKHYPIPYQVAKIAIYMGTALILYFFTKYTSGTLSHLWLKLSIHTLLLGAYISVIVFLELKGIRKLLK